MMIKTNHFLLHPHIFFYASCTVCVMQALGRLSQPNTVRKLMPINNKLITLANRSYLQLSLYHWLNKAVTARKTFNKETEHLVK